MTQRTKDNIAARNTQMAKRAMYVSLQEKKKLELLV